MNKVSRKFFSKQLLLILFSVTCEFYLFTLFVILSPEISQDLIPIADKSGRELFGLCIFLIAGFCRPLGGILFSGLGDSPHRYKIFFISTIIMSISSIMLGVLPGASDIGIVAPIMLIIIRIVQGVVVGAEIPEGIIYTYEISHKRYKVLATNLVSITCGGGFMIAILYTLLANKYLGHEGWRIGMVSCGIFNLVLGYFLRSAFRERLGGNEVSFSPKFSLLCLKRFYLKFRCDATIKM